MDILTINHHDATFPILTIIPLHLTICPPFPHLGIITSIVSQDTNLPYIEPPSPVQIEQLSLPHVPPQTNKKNYPNTRSNYNSLKKPVATPRPPPANSMEFSRAERSRPANVGSGNVSGSGRDEKRFFCGRTQFFPNNNFTFHIISPL